MSSAGHNPDCRSESRPEGRSETRYDHPSTARARHPRSAIIQVPRPDGEKTVMEIVHPGSWDGIAPVQGRTDAATFREIERLFRFNILPGKPDSGRVVLISLPEELEDPFPVETPHGRIFDRDCRVRYWLNRLYSEGGMTDEGKDFALRDPEYRRFWRALRDSAAAAIVDVHGGPAHFLPIYRGMGSLRALSRGRIVFNSHFFQMETTDCATVWDVMGNPFGLLVQKGEVILPPLFGREALLVDGQSVSRIARPDIRDLSVHIGNDAFRHGSNAEFFCRPAYGKTPEGAGIDLAIVGRRIVGSKAGGGMDIPEGGFALRTAPGYSPSALTVTYEGMEDLRFAVQAGPAMVVDGAAVRGFGSPFFAGEGPAFPPTVFPLDWEKGRAARIGLGSKDGLPVVLWVEGRSKVSYTPGLDSCGASLAEFAEACSSLNLDNLINLDGGGSAQICVDGDRRLRLSDRYPDSGRGAERPVPLGLSFDILPGIA